LAIVFIIIRVRLKAIAIIINIIILMAGEII
jgi:hypothetical protein